MVESLVCLKVYSEVESTVVEKAYSKGVNLASYWADGTAIFLAAVTVDLTGDHLVVRKVF